MITPEQEEALHIEVNAAVDSAASIASVIAPEFLPYIVLGQAIAKAVPSLYVDVQKLLSGQAPAPEDVKALSAKIALLAEPETL